MKFVNKDFCLSSYMAFRYIWKNDMDFYKGFHHSNFQPIPNEKRNKVSNPESIDKAIQEQIDVLYQKYENIGILLSGGIDSGILASYLKPGSHAYTFCSDTGVFDADIERAQKYCLKFGLIHHLVEINFEDIQKFTPIVFAKKCAPVHSIEPQIYKAAINAKKDGVNIVLVGESADLIFGGMDKLIAPKWIFDDFVKRYTFLEPDLVLRNPIDQSELFEHYRVGDNGTDHMKFMDEVFAIESSSSYYNAFLCADIPYFDPYAHLMMAKPLNLDRIRNGEPKYMIRGLFAGKYPMFEIPSKIPMPRPVDYFFMDWEGPKRPEFRTDIPISTLSGNQKWQLWCAESFLNYFD